MGRRRTAEQIADAVQRAGRSSVDPRTHVAAADLSPAAIAMRRGNSERTGNDLIELAARVFNRAKQLAKIAQESPRPSRRRRASRAADDALATAAVQIRLAQLAPLTRPYLHTISAEQIQRVEADVRAIMAEDTGALAVDVHRRIQDQRARQRAEGTAR